LTVAAAVIFMVTSLSLSILSKGRFMSTSVLDLKKKEPPVAEAPVTPPATGGESAPTETAPVNPAEGQAPAAPAPAAPTSLPETAPKTSP
jgi:hypothetical protein